MPEPFEFTTHKLHTIPGGFLVAFMPVWDYSESAKREATEGGGDLFELEPDVLSGIEGYILEVGPKTVIDMDGAPVVRCGAFAVSAIPEVNPEEGAKIEYGDTHDFRSRTFDTQQEAERFLDYTLRRWSHLCSSKEVKEIA